MHIYLLAFSFSFSLSMSFTHTHTPRNPIKEIVNCSRQMLMVLATKASACMKNLNPPSNNYIQY